MKKGITLISLVITIIIMLILAGVGIAGSLALIEEAKYAAFANKMKQADEAVYLVIMEGQLEGKTTEEILADIGEKIPEEVLKNISESLKLEILYARDGFPGNKLPIPEDYSEELANFSSEENLNSLFIVNASVAGKEKAYIYDEQSASVYKVEATIIWGVEMHGYDYGDLLVTQPGLLERVQKKDDIQTEDSIFYESFEMPALTSNDCTIDGKRYIVSASSELDSARVAYHAFDGNGGWYDSYCWHATGGAPQWLQIQFPDKIQIKAFTIRNRNSSISYCVRNFTLQGSNDGITWENLGEYTVSAGSSVATSFTVENPKYYYYYRLYITTVDSYAIIGEMLLDDALIMENKTIEI